MSMHAITARAPTRLDFGGGWTDVPPYSHEEGGFVCNLAIARYATVRVEPSNAASNRGGAEASVGGPATDAGDGALAAAVLRRYGAVGAKVSQSNDFPMKAGLGGSSAAGVAMIAAMMAITATDAPSGGSTPLLPRDIDRSRVAEASRSIEVDELGVAGGRQDHYAAAYGGALALTFGDDTLVRRLTLSPEARRALTRRLIVVYTGESRISGETITAVLDAYDRREARVLGALQYMKGLAREMAVALEHGDVDALGALVGAHWTHQRALHPAIPTARIDAIIARGTEAGALGAKALGASGGGCVLLVAGEGREQSVRDAVSPLSELVEFSLDEEGAHCWLGDSPQSPHTQSTRHP
jgi:D-glycero-alpha-D-manno-heptose-7-phosphate kinase